MAGRLALYLTSRLDSEERVGHQRQTVPNGVRQMRMMNEFEAQVLSDLKTQMAGLMGDGNGSHITDLERRMEQHEQNW